MKGKILFVLLFLFLLFPWSLINSKYDDLEKNLVKINNKQEMDKDINISTPKINNPDIYDKHKKIINLKLAKQIDSSGVNLETTLKLLNSTEHFHILTGTEDSYRTAVCQLINSTWNSYFYVEDAIINAFGIDTVRSVISIESDIFEKKIYSKEIESFGSTNGILGDIGDGKILILFANLFEGAAGYYSPINEYSQEYLNNNDMSQYKSNEWEMIVIDFLDRLENTVAHELQHLIHYNHDQFEARWIDEGFAEFAGFITDTNPQSWNNITPFVQYYFKEHTDDSLLYWNYWSEEGKDVRIDYGGSYLFVLYLYERFGINIVRRIVNDSQQAIETLNVFLSQQNFTFNDIYKDWQTTLLVDSGIFNYDSIDFRITPQFTIDKEEHSTYSIPYYGFLTFEIDYLTTFFETTVINKFNRKLSISIIYFEGTNIQKIEQFSFANNNLTVQKLPSTTNILLSIGWISNECPIISGDFGIGPKISIVLGIDDSFRMHINSPSILFNDTHINIYGLNILFVNDTDIYYASALDNVYVTISNEKEAINSTLLFNTTLFYGWGNSIDIRNLSSGKYEIVLHAFSHEYSLTILLFSFEITFDIIFTKPIFTYNNTLNTINISTAIDVFPEYMESNILNNTKVYAFIYNQSEDLVEQIELAFSNGIWEYNGTIELNYNCYYFTYIHIYTNRRDYRSLPSDLVLISQNTDIERGNNISQIILAVFIPPIAISGIYFIFKRKLFPKKTR